MLATGLRYVSPGSRGSRMLDTVVAHYVLVGYVSECEVDTEDSVVFVSGLWSNAPKQDLPYRFLQAKFCVLGRALYQQFGRNRLFLLFTPLRVRSRPHRL